MPPQPTTMMLGLPEVEDEAMATVTVGQRLRR
uniref:Uncharacterized protein n=1 Tax=Arundo donax TaxID=35708 RepID=A0A0A9FZ55_ARUDO